MQVISHQLQELHILEFQPCFPYWSLFCHTIIFQGTNVHKSWKLVGINIKLTMGSRVCDKSKTFYLWATHLLSWVITFLLNFIFWSTCITCTSHWKGCLLFSHAWVITFPKRMLTYYCWNFIELNSWNT